MYSRLKLIPDARGNLTVATALLAIPVLLAVGAAIDLGRIATTRQTLQDVADAAVLAGASAQSVAGSEAQKETQRAKITSNYLTQSLARASGMKLSGSPIVTADNSSVSVVVTASVPGSLMSVVNASRDDAGIGEGSGDAASSGARLAYDVQVTAKAKWTVGSNYICMLALNPSNADALSVTGTADVTAANCAVEVNSASATALHQSGSSTVTAAAISVKGNYSGGNLSPTPKTGADSYPDPLAVQFASDYATAMAAGTTRCSGRNASTWSAGTTSLSPGIYSGGWKVTHNVNLELQPGTYFLKDGPLQIMNGGTVTGTGVTIVLTGDSSAILDVQAQGNLTLKAPAGGPFAGIALAQHPATMPAANKGNSVIGGGQIDITGIAYFPSQDFYVTGNGRSVSNISTTAKQFAIIAGTITLRGNGQLNIGGAADFAAAGLPALPTAGSGKAKVSLVK